MTQDRSHPSYMKAKLECQARERRNAARRAHYVAKRKQTQVEGQVKNKMVRISFNSKPGATRKAARARRAALAVTVAASAADAPAQGDAADIPVALTILVSSRAFIVWCQYT